MRRRMIEPDLLTMLGIDCQLDPVADLDTAFFDSRTMRRELGRGMVCVEDFDNIAACGSDRPAIADLTARFAVERCLGSEQLDLISLYRFV